MRKWENSALVESLLIVSFLCDVFFSKKTKMCVMCNRGIDLFVESQNHTVVQSYEGMMKGN